MQSWHGAVKIGTLAISLWRYAVLPSTLWQAQALLMRKLWREWHGVDDPQKDQRNLQCKAQSDKTNSEVTLFFYYLIFPLLLFSPLFHSILIQLTCTFNPNQT